MKKQGLTLVLSSFFSLFSFDQTEMITLSAEYLYPYGQFHHVEASCKGIWSDLDLFLTHEPVDQLNDQWPVVNKKLDGLLKAIQKLATSAEAATYLSDDVYYLMRLVGCIANKYRLVREKMRSAAAQVPAGGCFESMAQHLKQLAAASREVVVADL
jgi:hypothetical protein